MGRAFSFAVALLRPKIVRLSLTLLAGIATYDAVSNQFEWPKIPRILGMTGSLLPLWGWLLVAQAILMLALFDYVRRNVRSTAGNAQLLDEPRVRQIAEEVWAGHSDAKLQNAFNDLAAAHAVVIERDVFDHVNERFDAQLKQIAIQAAEFVGFKAEAEKRLLANDYAFAAIGHREFLLDRASKLEQEAGALFLEAYGGSLAANGTWTEWEKRYKYWRGVLEEWLIFANPYWSNLQEVRKTPDNIHKLSWTFGDGQFPDSAAIHEYRTFCVLHHNWNDVKDKVHAEVRRVAFEGKLPIGAK